MYCTGVSAHKAKVIALYSLSGGDSEAQVVIWFAKRAPHLTAEMLIFVTLAKSWFLGRFTSNRESYQI